MTMFTRHVVLRGRLFARRIALIAVFTIVLAGCTPTAATTQPAPPAPTPGGIVPQPGGAAPAPALTPPAASGANPPAPSVSEQPTAIESAFIKNNTFSPASMVVQVGTIVLWTNQDSTPHTVKGPGWELGPFGNGESWAHTFNKVGQEEIHCPEHPEMTMKVTVMEKTR